LHSQIYDAFNQLEANNDAKKKSALVVSGDALIIMFNSQELKAKFLEIGLKVSVVLACRVSPK
jgi:hypothetical protein